MQQLDPFPAPTENISTPSGAVSRNLATSAVGEFLSSLLFLTAALDYGPQSMHIGKILFALTFAATPMAAAAHLECTGR